MAPRIVAVAGFDPLPRPDPHHLPETVKDDDLAYIISTSGTTGRPNGVMISSGSVFDFLSQCESVFNSAGETGSLKEMS